MIIGRVKIYLKAIYFIICIYLVTLYWGNVQDVLSIVFL